MNELVWRVYVWREYIDHKGLLQKQQVDVKEEKTKYDAEVRAKRVSKSGNDHGIPYIEFGIVRADDESPPTVDDVPDLLSVESR
jgi:hypothetical protein